MYVTDELELYLSEVFALQDDVVTGMANWCHILTPAECGAACFSRKSPPYPDDGTLGRPKRSNLLCYAVNLPPVLCQTDGFSIFPQP